MNLPIINNQGIWNVEAEIDGEVCQINLLREFCAPDKYRIMDKEQVVDLIRQYCWEELGDRATMRATRHITDVNTLFLASSHYAKLLMTQYINSDNEEDPDETLIDTIKNLIVLNLVYDAADTDLELGFVYEQLYYFL